MSKRSLRRGVVILANPSSNISCGKFLIKFCKVVAYSAEKLFVVNDGRVQINVENVQVIPSCWLNALFINVNKSLLSSIINYILIEINLTVGLLRCHRFIDVVFVFPFPTIVPVIISKLLRKKVLLFEAQDITVEEENSSEALKFAYQKLLRELTLPLYDMIVVEGSNVVRFQRLQKFLNRIYVCPLYVDISNYRIKKTITERAKIIGFIGSLEHRKGVLEFVKAAKSVCDLWEDVHFVIVGTGKLSEKLKSIIKELGLQNRVKMVEFIPEAQLPEFLNKLKVLVLPSISEGLPNIILEAMACGTIVIATAVGAIPDVVKDSKTGFLLENNSAKSIKEAIINTMSRSDLDLIANSARNEIEKVYTLQKAVLRYRELLKLCSHEV
jgi:glycosyltransferase involved in cell wall biosynthesis